MSRSRTHQQTPPSSPPRSRTRAACWLRFGPGLLIVAFALWLAWGPFRPQLAGRSPRFDRSALTSIPAPPAAPELSWVLAQRESLALSNAQVRELRRLEARWEHDTRSLHEALVQASNTFDRTMAEREKRSLNVQELQEQAAPVSELSRRLSEARRACWTEASIVLTPQQKRQAEEAWSQRLAGGRQASPLKQR